MGKDTRIAIFNINKAVLSENHIPEIFSKRNLGNHNRSQSRIGFVGRSVMIKTAVFRVCRLFLLAANHKKRIRKYQSKIDIFTQTNLDDNIIGLSFQLSSMTVSISCLNCGRLMSKAMFIFDMVLCL